MKRPWTMILILLFIMGCLRPTPYQKLEQGSSCCGYADQHLQGNIYKVTFSGNKMTDRETVTKYAYRRAAEVCKGKGYRNYKMLTVYQGGESAKTMYGIESADVELRFECKK